MANNINKFLTIYRNKTYDEFPLCEADIVAGAILSYADFNASSKTKKYNLEHNLAPASIFHGKRDSLILSRSFLHSKEAEKVIKDLLLCKRYHLTRISYFANIKENEDEATQFFAFTAISKSYALVFFRGTDTSLVGWKEDLDLAFKDKIPSQKLAKAYVYKIADLTDKPIILVGHSKGGNLAFYTYITASQKIKNRIYKVYNLDGPGFCDPKIQIDNEDKKLIKIVPSNSVIGMLMEKGNSYEVVKSYKSNINAHDPITWEFSSDSRYCKLARSKRQSKYSLAIKYSINDWLPRYQKKDFRDMADFIYQVAVANKQTTILNLKLDIIKKRKIYLDKISNYSTKKKEKLKVMSRDFVKTYFTILFHIKEYQ